MTPYDVLLVAGIGADAWLAAYALVRLRRVVAKAAYVAWLASAVLATGAAVGLRAGALQGPAEGIALWGFVASHPLAALFVLVGVHGETLFRRHPYILALVLPAPVLAALPPPGGYDLATVYLGAPLNWYLVLCLAAALGETAAAWHRSVARKGELLLLLVGAVVLVLGGPVYGFELSAVGVAEGAGTNPAVPLAAGIFAVALTRADPLPMGRLPSGAGPDPHFPAGRLVLIDEVRPKGSAHFVRRVAEAGRPAILLARGSPGTGATPGPAAVAGMVPRAWLPSSVAATVSEFLAWRPGGLAFLRDLSYVVAQAGLPATRDLLGVLRSAVARTGGTVVASLALLTPAERESLLGIPGAAGIRLPDPADEVEAILATRLGAGAAHILRTFAGTRRVRREDLTYEDVPALQGFLVTAIAELGRTPGDAPAVMGWRKALDHVSLELDRFARRTLPETAAGPWPSQVRASSGEDLVVRASEYWRGRELEEAIQAAAQAGRSRFAERVRGAFVLALGRAGDVLFEAEARRLRKKPEEIGPEDVGVLAEGAESAVASLGAAIDVPAGRADLEERARRLRALLAGLQEEAGRAA